MTTVFRPVKGELRVQVDYVEGKPTPPQLFARAGCRRVEFDASRKLWRVSRSRTQEVIEVLRLLGPVDVYIDGLVSQKCDIRCTKAAGDDCVCSCAGSNHGGTSNGWIQVGTTALVNHERTRAHYRIEAAA